MICLQVYLMISRKLVRTFDHIAENESEDDQNIYINEPAYEISMPNLDHHTVEPIRDSFSSERPHEYNKSRVEFQRNLPKPK